MKFFYCFLVVFYLLGCFTARGLGKECEQFCTMEYSPRCATVALADGTVDQKTFSNACALRVHNCLHDTNYEVTKMAPC